jgi:hypothetical protein
MPFVYNFASFVYNFAAFARARGSFACASASFVNAAPGINRAIPGNTRAGLIFDLALAVIVPVGGVMSRASVGCEVDLPYEEFPLPVPYFSTNRTGLCGWGLIIHLYTS